MERDKLMKLAKVLDTVANVGMKVFRVVAVVCGVFAVLLMVFGERMIEPASFVLELDFVKFRLADRYQTVTPLMKLYTVLGILSAGAVCVGFAYGLQVLRRILLPMKEGRPFEHNVPACLRRMAVTVLVVGIFSQMAAIAERIVLMLALPMDEIFQSAAIRGLEFSFRMDYGFVLLFVVLLLLSHVFAYGQELQKQSDETL